MRVLSFLVLILSLAGIPAEANEAIIGHEEAILTQAPHVPPPILRHHATKVIVHLEAKEVVGRLADGVKYTFWTFGGQVPGNFIRVRQGDLVEMHLKNSAHDKMPHNLDMHAAVGPGGGAASTFTAPGHESVFSFRANTPGLFVYHCATAPVGMHIANGMYGLIFVQPKNGLPKVDHEYYVMQGEFYTKGAYGQPGLQSFSMSKAIKEQPEYVVFNGAVGSLTGPNALKAKTGQTVRLFVGNGGPNLISSFHVIGEIFSSVNQEAGSYVNHNVQTTLIPAGGAAIVQFKAGPAGVYSIVDHSIFRAFNQGALGQIQVEGQSSPKKIVAPLASAPSGSQIFKQNCMACHQANGKGIPGTFPPLAKSDFLNADKARAIYTVVHGRSGKITVNGKDFNGVMPAWRPTLTDDEIAHVLTYVYHSWGNSGKTVSPSEVHDTQARN